MEIPIPTRVNLRLELPEADYLTREAVAAKVREACLEKGIDAVITHGQPQTPRGGS